MTSVLMSKMYTSSHSPGGPAASATPREPSFMPPFIYASFFFLLPSDVFAIGDPNQPTLLAVSVAGGIVLLVFLVTCFVVSGRYGQIS